MRKLTIVVFSMAILIGGFALGYLSAPGVNESAGSTFTHTAAASEDPLLSDVSGEALTTTTLREVAKEVSPAVVAITAKTAVKVRQQRFPFWFFQEPFGFRDQRRRAPKSEEKRHSRRSMLSRSGQ